MEKTLSSFSTISSSGHSRPCVEADLEIVPTWSFDGVVSAISNLLNKVQFTRTNRFDEFPAVIGKFDRHEVVLFDFPKHGLLGIDADKCYRLTVSPCGSLMEVEVENVDEKLAECIRSMGIECKPTQAEEDF